MHEHREPQMSNGRNVKVHRNQCEEDTRMQIRGKYGKVDAPQKRAAGDCLPFAGGKYSPFGRAQDDGREPGAGFADQLTGGPILLCRGEGGPGLERAW